MLAVALLIVASAAEAATPTEAYEQATVVDGFAWAENMCCTNTDRGTSLYVTENRRGELYAINSVTTDDGAIQTYSKTMVRHDSGKP